MNAPAAIEVSRLTHHYGSRRALDGLDFQVEAGEIFAIVGPNGGGKTTLFRILSTLVPVQQGDVAVFGCDVTQHAASVRSMLGVVFQAPSLDKKLTVAENLRHQGHLYGMQGMSLARRSDDMLARLRLTERRGDLVEQLSGGLRRRVELAKGMLHGPRLLLLDEPSTGLDPAARNDLWSYLESVRRDDGVTVILTTHLLDEAAKADRVAILHQGQLVALDTPARLQATVGGDAITIRATDCERLAEGIRNEFNCAAEVMDKQIRLEQPDGHKWIARLVEAFPGQIDSVTFARPTLEDVFIDRTGQRFRQEIDQDDA